MSSTASILEGYKTVLPPVVIEALGLTPSSQVVFEVTDNGKVTLSAKATTFADLVDRLPKRKRAVPASDEEIQRAIKAGAAKRFRKAKA